MFAPVRVILLDVAGTTSRISFVYQTLFPYARRRIHSFLEQHGDDFELSSIMETLKRENAADIPEGAPHFLDRQDQDYAKGVAAYCLWLMDRDRKSTPLKALQGLIWREGFTLGELSGE